MKRHSFSAPSQPTCPVRRSLTGTAADCLFRGPGACVSTASNAAGRRPIRHHDDHHPHERHVRNGPRIMPQLTIFTVGTRSGSLASPTIWSETARGQRHTSRPASSAVRNHPRRTNATAPYLGSHANVTATRESRVCCAALPFCGPEPGKPAPSRGATGPAVLDHGRRSCCTDALEAVHDRRSRW